ncbi:hypothetical protein COB55_04290 [Candidatus Wolfebacteria bacterium]|nr:MAG: hypothetical protein COB55_04290 [Candidatus Wolfebacteria bacterium]
MFNKNNRGLALIELMVSISILAILSAIVFANLSDSRVKAKNAKAQEEVTLIYNSVISTEADIGRFPLSQTLLTPAELNSEINFLDGIGMDPWGRSYEYLGCPGPCGSCAAGTCELGAWKTSVCSAGPDGVLQSADNPPVGDDICAYFGNQSTSW